MKWFSFRHCCLAAVIVTIYACTRTTDPAPLPQNRILSFKVANLIDTVIYGSIDDIDNTITVYVPFYYGLTLIDPQIELSAGARLNEEVLPVNIGETAIYNVSGADGSKRSYKLSIVLQNTPPLNAMWAVANLTSYPRANMPSIKGNFWVRNKALLKLLLRHQFSGKTINLEPGVGNMQINAQDEYSFGGIAIPPDTDTGYYKLELGFLGHQVTLEQPIHLVHRQPNVNVLGRVAKQGEVISFNPTTSSILLDFAAAKVEVNGASYQLPIVSYTPLEMKLKIPDDFPPGEYSSAKYNFQFTGWAAVNKTSALTVNPK